jgi:hypothetical protein
MGGCGGKKQRERLKATATLGGKFNSIGSREEQQSNLALIVKLLGEIGSDGVVSSNDRLFLDDVRIKLRQMGQNASFGWRQVEKMVAVHKAVVEGRRQKDVQG